MRLALLLSVCLPVCLTGCSLLVIGTGVRLDELENRETVHQKFGFPAQHGHTENLQTEEYLTHRKKSEH